MLILLSFECEMHFFRSFILSFLLSLPSFNLFFLSFIILYSLRCNSSFFFLSLYFFLSCFYSCFLPSFFRLVLLCIYYFILPLFSSTFSLSVYLSICLSLCLAVSKYQASSIHHYMHITTHACDVIQTHTTDARVTLRVLYLQEQNWSIKIYT